MAPEEALETLKITFPTLTWRNLEDTKRPSFNIQGLLKEGNLTLDVEYKYTVFNQFVYVCLDFTPLQKFTNKAFEPLLSEVQTYLIALHKLTAI